MSRSHRSLAVLLAILACAGAVSGTSAVIADTALADPYIDQLAEAADTPTLSWADCGDGFLCATAAVPLNYHRPSDEQIDLAVIKLPATDPGRRIGTLFVNFGGPWTPSRKVCRAAVPQQVLTMCSASKSGAN